MGRDVAALPRPRRAGRDDAALGDCARLALRVKQRERIDAWCKRRRRPTELEADHAIIGAQLGQLSDDRPRVGRPELVLLPDAASSVT